MTKLDVNFGNYEDNRGNCDMTLDEYRRLMAQRKADRKRNVVSVRLNRESLIKAKSLGPGYTGVLSRIIELGLNDQSILMRCL